MSTPIGTEVSVETNLFFEVKRIIETILNRSDFSYLIDVPDDDKEIVFPDNYIAGINTKIPCVAINCDSFDEEGFEMGGGPGANANFWIHIYSENRSDTMNIASVIKKELHAKLHDFYDFSTGDIPNIEAAYSSLVFPAVSGGWEVIAEDISQFITRQDFNKGGEESTEQNFLRRYKCTLNGIIRYNR